MTNMAFRRVRKHAMATTGGQRRQETLVNAANFAESALRTATRRKRIIKALNTSAQGRRKEAQWIAAHPEGARPGGTRSATSLGDGSVRQSCQLRRTGAIDADVLLERFSWIS